MRIRLLSAILLCSCATTAHDDVTPPAAVATEPTSPAPVDPPATPPPPPAPTPPPAKDCSLAAVADAPEVAATFVVGAPPVMTGGTLGGDYAVKHATVYL